MGHIKNSNHLTLGCIILLEQQYLLFFEIKHSRNKKKRYKEDEENYTKFSIHSLIQGKIYLLCTMDNHSN